jgi:Tol biopolymer transport system component
MKTSHLDNEVRFMVIVSRMCCAGFALAVVGCGATGDEVVGIGGAAVTLNAVTRESVTNAGVQGNGDSAFPDISADGRFVAFESAAGNFVSGDTNGNFDIFVKDRQTGAITRVSTSPTGGQANSNSFTPSISADGRFVAFQSFATNLLPNTSNCIANGCIFVKDRTTGALVQADVATSGQANGASGSPDISGDGRFVAFQSAATNLVAGDANGHIDIFVRDLQANTTVLASVLGTTQGDGDSTEPSISADGHIVAFSSLADNLRVPGDGNGTSDVFRRDLVNQTTEAVSFTSTGQGGATGNGASDAPHISGDGNVVVFRSLATNFGTVPDTNNVADTYIKTVGTLTPIRVSISTAGVQGNGASGQQSAISFNGQYVAFVSNASNLVSGDTNGFPDLFIRDRNLNQTIRANVSNSGQQANGGFFAQSSLSFNGSSASPTPSLVAFDSIATNLVQPDSNGFSDVFTASISP